MREKVEGDEIREVVCMCVCVCVCEAGVGIRSFRVLYSVTRTLAFKSE